MAHTNNDMWKVCYLGAIIGCTSLPYQVGDTIKFPHDMNSKYVVGWIDETINTYHVYKMTVGI